VHVDVAAPEKPLTDLLSKIPGAKQAEVSAHPGGHLTAIVESAPGQDIRSQIAAKIVESGWPLYELRGASLSLEDIFLQLTTDDAAHAAQPSN